MVTMVTVVLVSLYCQDPENPTEELITHMEIKVCVCVCVCAYECCVHVDCIHVVC